ncbi:MAG TPA: family 20 glycosylhydrolase [Actinophytocola sp.]|uniref:family 20 glycosylhydrolase n=1 Tax=Actinophytocola sp. TaxID=1872138 RepID=UPI002DBA0541|nr:family 20 glycosylhydrolase [Actinophytocola sp.]HEU5471780.1 family 20 glycosylhydrolase [Actinophytocola sp.]
MKGWALGVVAVLAVGCTSTPPPEPLPPGPPPVTVPALTGWTSAAGRFELTPDSRIVVDPEQEHVRDDAETFAGDAAEIIGRRLPVVTEPRRSGDIVLGLDGNRADLGAEGYALSVADMVTVTARTDAGAFYGTRTLLQMLRAGGPLPAGAVTDVPRYAERGVGICACIVHISTDALHRLIRDASYLKLNQLWIELKVRSDAYPDTVEWGYYTKLQAAALQELAARYHVTLVPEVDAPGHMTPWLRNRPELQLAGADGTRNPTVLDVTKPEAFDYVTGLIDEYLTVFDTPFWHLGADEYLIGDDYANYPHLLDYARARYGPQAVAQDALIDFINRVNAHVKAKGKRLRIWNDGLIVAQTVPLDTDIVIEHWQGGHVRPSALIDRGHDVMNAAEALYLGRGTGKADIATLYARDWSPLFFQDEAVAPSAKVTGAKLTLWPDNGSAETENETEAHLFLPLRFIAQSTWGATRPDPDITAFTRRAERAGRSPGIPPPGNTPIPDAPVTLALDEEYLTPAEPTPGAALTTAAEPSTWRIDPTPDGYHTLRHVPTNLCAESRLGTRDLNTPLEPGTPITAETCAATNRLQRWQLARTNDTVTLTNAITRMIAVHTDVLVQEIPHEHTAATFALKPST